MKLPVYLSDMLEMPTKLSCHTYPIDRKYTLAIDSISLKKLAYKHLFALQKSELLMRARPYKHPTHYFPNKNNYIHVQFNNPSLKGSTS